MTPRRGVSCAVVGVGSSLALLLVVALTARATMTTTATTTTTTTMLAFDDDGGAARWHGVSHAQLTPDPHTHERVLRVAFDGNDDGNELLRTRVSVSATQTTLLTLRVHGNSLHFDSTTRARSSYDAALRRTVFFAQALVHTARGRASGKALVGTLLGVTADGSDASELQLVANERLAPLALGWNNVTIALMPLDARVRVLVNGELVDERSLPRGAVELELACGRVLRSSRASSSPPPRGELLLGAPLVAHGDAYGDGDVLGTARADGVSAASRAHSLVEVHEQRVKRGAPSAFTVYDDCGDGRVHLSGGVYSPLGDASITGVANITWSYAERSLCWSIDYAGIERQFFRAAFLMLRDAIDRDELLVAFRMASHRTASPFADCAEAIDDAESRRIEHALRIAGNGYVNITTTFEPSGVARAELERIELPQPIVHSLSHDAGSMNGGNVIRITGDNFVDDPSATCHFGSLGATRFHAVNATTGWCAGPACSRAEPAQLLVSNDCHTKSAQTVSYYCYAPCPTLVSLSPRSGSLCSAYDDGASHSVTLVGENFFQLNSTTCTFGDERTTTCSVKAGSEVAGKGSTIMSCPVPCGSVPTTVPVRCTNDGVTFSDALDYTYTQVRPEIQFIVPVDQRGSIEGSTRVTVVGRNFVDSPLLACEWSGLGTTPATHFANATLELVTCDAPAITPPVHDPMHVHLRVTNDGTTFTAAIDFEYTVPQPRVDALAPSFGYSTPGRVITVRGAAFVGVNSCCHFRMSNSTDVAVKARLHANTDYTTLECTQPTLDTLGAYSFVVSSNCDADDAASSSEPLEYTVRALPPPTIERLYPSVGPTTGGTTVTVLGESFVANDNLCCRFGDADAPLAEVAASPLYGLSTAVTCSSPSHNAAEAVEFTVCNDCRDASSCQQFPVNRFTYQLTPPLLTSVRPSRAAIAGGKAITIDGAGFYNVDTLRCRFGDEGAAAVDAEFVSVERVVIVVPAVGTVGVVALACSNDGGEHFSNSLPFNFTATELPAIVSLAPDVAHTRNASQTVTVSGHDFGEPMYCRFGSALENHIVEAVSTPLRTPSSQPHWGAGINRALDELEIYSDGTESRNRAVLHLASRDSFEPPFDDAVQRSDSELFVLSSRLGDLAIGRFVASVGLTSPPDPIPDEQVVYDQQTQTFAPSTSEAWRPPRFRDLPVTENVLGLTIAAALCESLPGASIDADGKCDTQVDLVVSLDASSDVSATEFADQLAFVEHLVSTWQALDATTGLRLALVQYAHDAMSALTLTADAAEISAALSGDRRVQPIESGLPYALCDVPYEHDPLLTSVSLSNDGIEWGTSMPFTYYRPPAVLTSVTPASASTAGGDEVVVVGEYFQCDNGDCECWWQYTGGARNAVRSSGYLHGNMGNTALNCTVPRVDVAGEVELRVGENSVYVESVLFNFELAVPSMVFHTPTMASTAGGTLVVVMGTGFLSGRTTCMFGNDGEQWLNVLMDVQRPNDAIQTGVCESPPRSQPGQAFVRLSNDPTATQPPERPDVEGSDRGDFLFV